MCWLTIRRRRRRSSEGGESSENIDFSQVPRRETPSTSDIDVDHSLYHEPSARPRLISFCSPFASSFVPLSWSWPYPLPSQHQTCNTLCTRYLGSCFHADWDELKDYATDEMLAAGWCKASASS